MRPRMRQCIGRFIGLLMLLRGTTARVLPLLPLLAVLTTGPAAAILGGSPVGTEEPARRWTVMIEHASGRLCSGVLIGPMLALTAAHCTLGTGGITVTLPPPAGVGTGETEAAIPVVEVQRHPSFQPELQPRQQPGIDLAVLWLGRPMPASARAIELAYDLPPVPATVTVFGFGATQEGEIATARTLRRATLEHVGLYRHSSGATAQFAQDAQTKAQTPGRGACGGDSGGPVVIGTGDRSGLIGIVSWATGPDPGTRCGAYTAFVPMAAHINWIEDTATALTRKHTVPAR